LRWRPLWFFPEASVLACPFQSKKVRPVFVDFSGKLAIGFGAAVLLRDTVGVFQLDKD